MTTNTIQERPTAARPMDIEPHLEQIINTLETPLPSKKALAKTVGSLNRQAAGQVPETVVLYSGWPNARDAAKVPGDMTFVDLNDGNLYSLRSRKGEKPLQSCEAYGFNIRGVSEVNDKDLESLRVSNLSDIKYRLIADDQFSILVSPSRRFLARGDRIMMLTSSMLVRTGNDVYAFSYQRDVAGEPKHVIYGHMKF